MNKRGNFSWESPFFLIMGIIIIISDLLLIALNIILLGFMPFFSIDNFTAISLVIGLFVGIAFVIKHFNAKKETNNQPRINFQNKAEKEEKDIENNTKNNSLGISGFVLGICAFYFSFSFWIVSPIFVTLGLIFSILQLKREKTGFAIAGLILSIIGFLIFTGLAILTSYSFR